MSHDFARNVKDDVPAPKNAGRSMTSKSRVRDPKVKSEGAE